MENNKVTSEDIIIKIDYSSNSTIDRFIDLLKANNIEVKSLSRDEYLIKI
ncbi:Uncharacterised protein [uncultured Clostridium sp.]|nr:hypothetical protein [uncultured Clostridium sp.]SCJ36597.1 Uncharacterised protein [uncultured Clostridium sp.]